MNGIELSRQFFDEYIYPRLAREYARWLPALSAGLLGEGSDVLGFDDAISHDHNYSPRVVIWGDLFDFAGLGGDYATLLAKNLQFLQIHP